MGGRDALEGGGEVLGEELGEGLGQFGGDDFRFAVEFGLYEQAGEEGLVPGPLGDGVGFVVGLAGLMQELPRERETPFGRSVSAFGGVEFGLDGGDLTAEFCGTVGGEWWAVRRGLRRCAVCRHESSVTAGTIFHGSRLPLGLGPR